MCMVALPSRYAALLSGALQRIHQTAAGEMMAVETPAGKPYGASTFLNSAKQVSPTVEPSPILIDMAAFPGAHQNH